MHLLFFFLYQNWWWWCGRVWQYLLCGIWSYSQSFPDYFWHLSLLAKTWNSICVFAVFKARGYFFCRKQNAQKEKEEKIRWWHSAFADNDDEIVSVSFEKSQETFTHSAQKLNPRVVFSPLMGIEWHYSCCFITTVDLPPQSENVNMYHVHYEVQMKKNNKKNIQLISSWKQIMLI